MWAGLICVYMNVGQWRTLKYRTGMSWTAKHLSDFQIICLLQSERFLPSGVSKDIAGMYKLSCRLKLICNLNYMQVLNTEECTIIMDRLCVLVVRVLGYRSGGPGSIPGTTRKKM
jgi:hypothetical protein